MLVTENLGAYTDALREALLQKLVGNTLPLLSNDYAWQESALTHVLFALLAFPEKKVVPPLLEQSGKGGVNLFDKEGFSWGGLPYPRWHAELAAYLALFGKQSGNETLFQQALSMAKWQTLTLDHKGRPIGSFFSQEGKETYQELAAANYLLFYWLGGEFAKIAQTLKPFVNENVLLFRIAQAVTPFKEPIASYVSASHVVDEEGGFALFKEDNATVHLAGTGCKSSFGAYLLDEVALCAYGAQEAPLGECKTFGLVGGHTVPKWTHESPFTVETQTALAGEAPTNSPFPFLEDSGYRGCFIQCKQTLAMPTLTLETAFKPLFSPPRLAFVFYGHAPSCFVGGVQKLAPGSFDRYTGPPDEVTLKSAHESLEICPLSGAVHLEVIPLAEGDAFWGANFLIAYFPDPHTTFHVEVRALQKK